MPIKRSKQLTQWLLALHGAAILTVFCLLSIPLYYQILLSTLITLSFYYCWHRVITPCTPESIISLTPLEKERFKVIFANGHTTTLSLRSNSCITPNLLILRFICPRHAQHYRMLLLPDNLTPLAFRRLYSHLRYNLQYAHP